jgi:Cu(I)/Ag(I) efflux system membrane fusion protein/cobalt-zinc-cadmium efflux system membrane fusion protein
MNKAVLKEKSRSLPLRTIAITVVVTLMVASAVFQWFGSVTTAKPQRTMDAHTESQERQANAPSERKIAYWRAPMNPAEIYDQPGKSAMGMDLVPVYEDELAGGASAPGERKIAHWRAPMNPAEIYDKPGKSAMGMDLVPVYEDELAGGVDIRIDPVTQQNMGLRTAAVTRQPLIHTIRTYGQVAYDETRTVQISPKVSGWIETIHANFTGKSVAKGEPLFEIYAPELVAVQEEYLSAFRSARRLARDGQTDLLASTRRRLQYFDIAESEIQALEGTGNVRKTLLIRSPFSGVVIQKNAEEGSHIKAGTTVYRIADLSRIWVEAHVYEYELPWIQEGQEGEMTLPYIPGKTFMGTVAYVYPYLQPKTRDVVVRLEFDNPDLLLKPDMYVDVRIRAQAASEGLVIPSEAVIRSGERNIVFVAKGEGQFSPREVRLGLSLDGGHIQTLTGLSPGDLVVTSGQFLLDSESKLKEAVQKMVQAKTAPAGDTPAAAPDAFFKDMEGKKESDFFKDMENEKESDFFKDMEVEPRVKP